MQHRVVTTDNEIDSAIHQAQAFARVDRLVRRARYDREHNRIILSFADGVIVSIPRRFLQGLQGASPSELADIELLGQGTGLRWPRLDVDHYVLGLLNRVFGTKEWIAHLGQSGTSRRPGAEKAGSPKTRRHSRGMAAT